MNSDRPPPGAASQEREAELEAQEANYIGDPRNVDEDGFRSDGENSGTDKSESSAAPALEVNKENGSVDSSNAVVDDNRTQSASAPILSADDDGFADNRPTVGNNVSETTPGSENQKNSPNLETDVPRGTDDVAESVPPPTQEEATADLKNAAADPSPDNDGFSDERPGLEGDLSNLKKGWNLVKLVQEVDNEYNDSSAETVWGRIADVVGKHFIDEAKDAVGDAINDKVTETSPATALQYKWTNLVVGAPEIFLHPGAVWDRMKDTAQTASKISVDPAQNAAKDLMQPGSSSHEF